MTLLSTYLSMERPPEVALPPEAHAGSREEGKERLVGVERSLGPGGRGGAEAGGKLGEGPGLQQPLQARHVLGGRCPPVALLVNAGAAAAAPGQQVSGTGEGPPREEEDGAGDGVRLGEGGRGELSWKNNGFALLQCKKKQ